MENWSIRDIDSVAAHCIAICSGTVYYKEYAVFRLTYTTGARLTMDDIAENGEDFEQMLQTHCGGRDEAVQWIRKSFFSPVPKTTTTSPLLHREYVDAGELASME